MHRSLLVVFALSVPVAKAETHLPAAASGINLWMQALHLGAVSNVVASSVQ